MSETRLHTVLQRIASDLAASRAPYALVGGLAVSSRTEPRFTRDLDLAVAVKSDSDAEGLIRFLKARGYRIDTLVEQEAVDRLATVRLIPSGEPTVVVDLLFASSGIEPEIVAAAEPVEIIEGVVVRIATIAHLIATKVLSRDDNRRPQDRMDLVGLLKAAGESDIIAARDALNTIQERGFNRGKDLPLELADILQTLEP
jgi:predicted nucleotidyltransferase